MVIAITHLVLCQCLSPLLRALYAPALRAVSVNGGNSIFLCKFCGMALKRTDMKLNGFLRLFLPLQYSGKNGRPYTLYPMEWKRTAHFVSDPKCGELRCGIERSMDLPVM